MGCGAAKAVQTQELPNNENAKEGKLLYLIELRKALQARKRVRIITHSINNLLM